MPAEAANLVPTGAGTEVSVRDIHLLHAEGAVEIIFVRVHCRDGVRVRDRGGDARCGQGLVVFKKRVSSKKLEAVNAMKR